jgi:uncharacterized protein DUF5658
MDVTAAVLAATITVGALAPAEVSTPEQTATVPAAVVVAMAEPTPIADAASSANDFLLAGRTRSSLTGLASRRPAPLVPLYATLAMLQGLDIYSTKSAMSRGAVEANPGMKAVAGNAWASTAVKAAATAGSIYFIERAWKQNRKGAVVLATVINAATAAVVAHNTQVSGRK